MKVFTNNNRIFFSLKIIHIHVNVRVWRAKLSKYLYPKSRCARCAVVAVVGRVSYVRSTRTWSVCARRGPLRHNRRNSSLCARAARCVYAPRSSFLFGSSRAHTVFSVPIFCVCPVTIVVDRCCCAHSFFLRICQLLEIFRWVVRVRTHKFFSSTYSYFFFAYFIYSSRFVESRTQSW